MTPTSTTDAPAFTAALPPDDGERPGAEAPVGRDGEAPQDGATREPAVAAPAAGPGGDDAPAGALDFGVDGDAAALSEVAEADTDQPRDDAETGPAGTGTDGGEPAGGDAPPAPESAAPAPEGSAEDGAGPGRRTQRGRADGQHGSQPRLRPVIPGQARRPAPKALRSFPRVDRPANVPVPEHHHLPGWVRRAHAQARPALGSYLALLQGDPRGQVQTKLDELTAGISSGKFSLAWQYPELAEEARDLWEKQRRQQAAVAGAQRALDTTRRRVSEEVRAVADILGADAAARLQRQLRAATDETGMQAVQAEVQRLTGSARVARDRRRDREIQRTRAKIQRGLPTGAQQQVEEPAETWQDVLRRFAQQQTAQGGSDGE